jgi:YggT family protein
MFSDFQEIIIRSIEIFFKALKFLIVLRVLLSWFAPHLRGKFVEFIFATSEPILAIFQRLPLRIGMVDLSPIVALIVLDLVQSFLLKIFF